MDALYIIKIFSVRFPKDQRHTTYKQETKAWFEKNILASVENWIGWIVQKIVTPLISKLD